MIQDFVSLVVEKVRLREAWSLAARTGTRAGACGLAGLTSTGRLPSGALADGRGGREAGTGPGARSVADGLCCMSE